ncbi:hypothetical protein C9446_11690 [Providencia heimbachae]|uniref:hypothetical protein n=1 Tax=Providencia heimbachae TaxID=333962 RepID=UPI0010BEAE82|nr:hypothetical protein [Providencia heimbachae]QCJ70452.1 hypothetical protein C9446_11690 [Providencia heimbachae]
MLDKKEIATLSIKISVDSTDLDKLEAQLKRIEGLMVSTGLKQPAKGGFIANFDAGHFNPKGCLEPVFTFTSGCTLINEAYIEKATLEKIMVQAAKACAEQAQFKITTGVSHNNEQSFAKAVLKSSAEVTRASKAVSNEQSEREKVERLIEDKFNQLQSSITAIQHTQANLEVASANAIEQVRADIQSAKSGWL